jgi:DNA-directed RNA polymerase, delta subunit
LHLTGSVGKNVAGESAAFFTFILAAFCPFTINYSAVLLTEIVTIFLMIAMMLAATYAIKAKSLSRAILFWALAGILGGAVVDVRPDSGLFALGLGVTLVIAALARKEIRKAFLPMLATGTAFTLAFLLVLAPWTIRNERVFGQFQPLAPEHAEAPGEFVPLGYYHWLRTWIDDFRYVSPMLWELEIHRIDMNKIPDSAFTDEQEKAEVAALIDQYNNSDPDHPMTPKKPAADSDDNDNSDDSADSDDNNSDDNDQDSDDSSDDEREQPDQELDLKISPAADAEFEKIAERRVANAPVRYYLVLPAERAATMWFDTHSEFYPFAGEIFPLEDIDSSAHQDIWLPLFAAGVWIYTLLALAGIILLWASGWPRARIWVTMALLIALSRVAFFGTLENPEPRYLMELFFIAAVLGGIALSRFRNVRSGQIWTHNKLRTR